MDNPCLIGMGNMLWPSTGNVVGHPISIVLSGWPFVREGCVAMFGRQRSEKFDGVG